MVQWQLVVRGRVRGAVVASLLHCKIPRRQPCRRAPSALQDERSSVLQEGPLSATGRMVISAAGGGPKCCRTKDRQRCRTGALGSGFPLDLTREQRNWGEVQSRVRGMQNEESSGLALHEGLVPLPLVTWVRSPAVKFSVNYLRPTMNLILDADQGVLTGDLENCIFSRFGSFSLPYMSS